MSKLWLYIDRVIQFFFRYYRKRTFLSKINNTPSNLRVLGEVRFNATNVEIGNNVTIYPGVYFWGSGSIKIGDNVDLGIDTIIYSKSNVTIGNNTSIAAQCYIIDSNHGTKKGLLINKQPLEFEREGITIGNDVWIGAGAKIIKGSCIKNGAVIGAMSLVNKEVTENSIAVGVPASVIKKRE